jgi:hypothetical protein
VLVLISRLIVRPRRAATAAVDAAPMRGDNDAEAVRFAEAA